MLVATGEALAGLDAAVFVNAELEAFGVDVVADSLHPIWKLGGVADQLALGCALFLQPAVIQHEVVVASIPHPGLDHRIRRVADKLFINFLLEGIPAIPAHRGCKCEFCGHSKAPDVCRLQVGCREWQANGDSC